MRTTLTIEDDVAKLLEDEARASGKSFKETVNHYLRLGLTTPNPRKPFVVKPLDFHLPPGVNYDKVEDILEAIEGPDYR